MYKKYVVRLSDEERRTCEKVIKNLKGSSQKAHRARILLRADADGPGWTDAKIAEAFECRVQTIENLRKRLVTEGFDLALDGRRRALPPTPPKLDGEGEAKLIAMRLGKPPAGYGHWTLQLLADELVALEVVDSISHETVPKTLKNGLTKRKIEYCVIPPEQDGEFVACIEEVLETHPPNKESDCPPNPLHLTPSHPGPLRRSKQSRAIEVYRQDGGSVIAIRTARASKRFRRRRHGKKRRKPCRCA